MLIYHPAYDAYHCVFRTLLITSTIRIIEVPKLRILDFYFCFPAELNKVRLPKGHGEGKRIARLAQNIYHGPISTHHVFRDMEHIQNSAFRTLAASSLIDTGEFESGLVRRRDLPIPQELDDRIKREMEENLGLINYITEKLNELPLLGENGLKHRTGLMEHRYDVA
jgi:hypothetical protein